MVEPGPQSIGQKLAIGSSCRERSLCISAKHQYIVDSPQYQGTWLLSLPWKRHDVDVFNAVDNYIAVDLRRDRQNKV